MGHPRWRVKRFAPDVFGLGDRATGHYLLVGDLALIRRVKPIVQWAYMLGREDERNGVAVPASDVEMPEPIQQ